MREVLSRCRPDVRYGKGAVKIVASGEMQINLSQTGYLCHRALAVCWVLQFSRGTLRLDILFDMWKCYGGDKYLPHLNLSTQMTLLVKVFTFSQINTHRNRPDSIENLKRKRHVFFLLNSLYLKIEWFRKMLKVDIREYYAVQWAVRAPERG